MVAGLGEPMPRLFGLIRMRVDDSAQKSYLFHSVALSVSKPSLFTSRHKDIAVCLFYFRKNRKKADLYTQPKCPLKCLPLRNWLVSGPAVPKPL
jgi:hypothetical protein